MVIYSRVSVMKKEALSSLGGVDAVIYLLDSYLPFEEEVEIENALEDLDTYGFLSSKKVIIIQNIESIKYDDFNLSYCKKTDSGTYYQIITANQHDSEISGFAAELLFTTAKIINLSASCVIKYVSSCISYL